MHRGNGLKFCMLLYPDHLQNWFDFGYSLLIFLILMLFWLGEMGQILGFPHYGDPLAEIGHIWGFWALSGERVGINVEGGRGIFPMLCVEFCLVCHMSQVMQGHDLWPAKVIMQLLYVCRCPWMSISIIFSYQPYMHSTIFPITRMIYTINHLI